MYILLYCIYCTRRPLAGGGDGGGGIIIRFGFLNGKKMVRRGLLSTYNTRTHSYTHTHTLDWVYRYRDIIIKRSRLERYLVVLKNTTHTYTYITCTYYILFSCIEIIIFLLSYIFYTHDVYTSIKYNLRPFYSYYIHI